MNLNLLSLEENYFTPVFFGGGITYYFYNASFPSLLTLSLLFFFCFLTFYIRYALFVALFFAGYGWMEYRTHIINTQFIQEPLEDIKLTGIVSNVELFPKNQRVTIDIPHHPFLQKIRLRVWKTEELIPGQTITFRANLMPFSQKTTPYSFDFKRDAFYKGINASGRVVKIMDKKNPKKQWLERLRQKIGNNIRNNMNGPAKELAVALTIGDKNGIPQKIRNYFADSGTSHILAISGLHLSLIAFFLLLFLQFIFCFFPILHEKYPIYKITPCIAWLFLLLYNFVSGTGYPVQRAFIMVSLFIVGIIIDRRTISLYSVCLAAFFIMILFPECIVNVSFQLSFGAVVPIIALYEKQQFSNWLSPIVSTVTASLGTLPFSIIVFKYTTLQAITGNLLALPLFSYIIMPLTMVSFFGFGFYFLEMTLNWLIWIAKFTSSLWWAHIPIPATTKPYFLLFFVCGGLWLCLVQNRLRFLGIIPIILSPLVYFPAHAPNFLTSSDGAVKAWRVNQKIYYTDSIRKGKFYLEEWERVYGIRIVKNKP